MKVYIKQFILGIVIFIATAMPIILDSIYNGIQYEDVLIKYFSYIPTTKNDYKILIEILTAIINIIYVVYVFSSKIYSDIKEKGIYILTRSRRTSVWILKEYVYIFKNIVLYYFIEIILLILIMFLCGMKTVSLQEVIQIAFLLLIYISLGTYVLIVISSLISLYINEVVGFLSVNSLFLVNMLLFNILINSKYINLIRYLPFTQYLLSIHDFNLIDRSLFNISIIDYTLEYSIIYLLSIIVIVVVISINRIRKMEVY